MYTKDFKSMDDEHCDVDQQLLSSNYHNFEYMPNGKSSEFKKDLCCEHKWSNLNLDQYTEIEDEDGAMVTSHVCHDCGAECLRDTVTREIVDYDNSKNVRLNTP